MIVVGLKAVSENQKETRLHHALGGVAYMSRGYTYGHADAEELLATAMGT
jgi:hypothetical protein